MEDDKLYVKVEMGSKKYRELMTVDDMEQDGVRAFVLLSAKIVTRIQNGEDEK